MTYRELAEYINNLTPEQKDMEVNVLIDQFADMFPLKKDEPVAEAGKYDPTLDEDHPYLII